MENQTSGFINGIWNLFKKFSPRALTQFNDDRMEEKLFSSVYSIFHSMWIEFSINSPKWKEKVFNLRPAMNKYEHPESWWWDVVLGWWQLFEMLMKFHFSSSTTASSSMKYLFKACQSPSSSFHFPPEVQINVEWSHKNSLILSQSNLNESMSRRALTKLKYIFSYWGRWRKIS